MYIELKPYKTFIVRMRVMKEKTFCSNNTDFPPFLSAVSREKLQLKIKS